jgi:hypothetical protein
MTIEEGRDVAAILRILRHSFGNGAVDNGMIDSLILMDKPIAQPSAFGEAQGKGNRQHSSLRCYVPKSSTSIKAALTDASSASDSQPMACS